MENISETNTTLQSLSRDLANVVEQASTAVVAVNGRRHLSSSGVYWRDGVIVTAAHTLRRTEDISVILSSGETVAATLAGADPSTDLAVLKINSAKLTVPSFGDTSQLKVGHVVLAVGRGAQRGLNATLGIVGVLSWCMAYLARWINRSTHRSGSRAPPGRRGWPAGRCSWPRLGY